MDDLIRSGRVGVANPPPSHLSPLVVVLALSCLSFVGEGQEKAVDAKPDVNEVRAKAEKGDAQAQFDFGWMYDEGKSVEQDSSEAAKWYLQAASRGQKRAQFKLGFMYSTGRGVERNDVEAVKWLNLSAAQGYVYPAQLRDVLVKTMTSEEVAEAQRRAARFVPMGQNGEGQRQAASPVPSSTQAR